MAETLIPGKFEDCATCVFRKEPDNNGSNYPCEILEGKGVSFDHIGDKIVCTAYRGIKNLNPDHKKLA